MIDFDTTTLDAIASLTGLTMTSDQAGFSEQLQSVLSYSEQLSTVAQQATPELSTPNVNVFRDDKAYGQNSTVLLGQAPQTEDSFFVVPQILS